MTAARPITAAAIAAFALVSAVTVAVPAAAAPGDDVLVFSNPSVVDTTPGIDGGEYEWISAAIAAAGFDVVPFDGGDGSASAWSAALTGIEAIVLPEQEIGVFYDPSSPPAWLSADAMQVIVDWVRAGGTFVLSSACDPDYAAPLNEIVGVNYDNVVDCSDASLNPRFIDDVTLPAGLEYADGTYGMSLTDMTAEQLAPLTVWYAGETTGCDGAAIETLAAGVFTAGSGRVAFEAWDYFNDGSPGQADWNAVLAALIDGNPAASTWVGTPAPSPTPKPAVTGSTAAGESMFTISTRSTCDSEHVLMRIDPQTAMAAPVGSAEIDGDAKQGAWSAADGRGYFPFFDFDIDADVLMTVDPATGAFAVIGEFDHPDLDYFNEVFSLAIGADGQAYLMADVEFDGVPYELALFSVDLDDASISFIAAIDDSVLDEPNGFAVDPQTGLFYAFEEDTLTLFQVNVATGGLVEFGVLDSASISSSTDVTALQIGLDGTFWVVFDEASEDYGDAGMLASFTLADISGGTVSATEVGIITDDPIASWSLMLVSGGPELAATGMRIAPEAAGLLVGSTLLLLIGGALLAGHGRRRRMTTV